jgi:hypothetical protein
MEILPKHNFNKFGNTENLDNKINHYMQQTFEHSNFNSFNNTAFTPPPDPI